MERWFFDTFGYATFDCNLNRDKLLEVFEKEIEINLNLPSLNGQIPVVGEKNRTQNIRFDSFSSDKIYSAFYNKLFLDEIYKYTDDFFVLSPMESFYLTNTFIHRDLASELKQIKILLYLNDLSCKENGPLYVLPGTHNLYDKYSSSIGENVAWPHPDKGSGEGFYVGIDYLNNNIPKTYIFNNPNKIILFNHNLFHGSDGNLNKSKYIATVYGNDTNLYR